MGRYRIHVTAQARSHLRAIASWWRENRRVLLPRTKHHMYYEVDDALQVVTILAVWHNARGRSPKL